MNTATASAPARDYTAEVRETLRGFTAKQLDVVAKTYTRYYIETTKRYLALQADYLPACKAIWAEKERTSGTFPPRALPNWAHRVPSALEEMGGMLRHCFTRCHSFLNRMDRAPDGTRYAYDCHVYVAKEDYRELCKVAGMETAKAIRAAFIAKNTDKLAAILEGKGDLYAIVVSSWSRSNFEGELSVTFEDGSSFTVRNKTVQKCNDNGTVFAQYPTTFHNTTFADGTKMAGANSLRRMRTQFAGLAK
jgi:hypothetical protein